MPSQPRPGVGALLLAAALVPLPSRAADTGHPLDPAAKAGVVSTVNVFDGLIPLLDRDAPVPSFAEDGPAPSPPAAAGSAPGQMPMDHGAMNHDAMGHGASQAAE
jgi:hypothetical protein